MQSQDIQQVPVTTEHAKEAIAKLVSFVPSKNALSSMTVQGVSVLFFLELADIFTHGSINTGIKLFLLFAGTGQALVGRARIKSSPITLNPFSTVGNVAATEVEIPADAAQAIENNEA